MFRVLKKARMPLFLHKKSNHLFTVWQHIVLLVLRQYGRKSYRMFVEWLVEAYYFRAFIQLSNIPHYTIPTRFKHIPKWRTHGKYRKQMKRGYSKVLYHKRNKDETIISVIKRLFGEYLTSRLIRTQNRELSFRCLAYNMRRLTNIAIITMFSTLPVIGIY